MHLHRFIVGPLYPSPHLGVDVLQSGNFDAVREHRVEAACLLQAAARRVVRQDQTEVETCSGRGLQQRKLPAPP